MIQKNIQFFPNLLLRDTIGTNLFSRKHASEVLQGAQFICNTIVWPKVIWILEHLHGISWFAHCTSSLSSQGIVIVSVYEIVFERLTVVVILGLRRIQVIWLVELVCIGRLVSCEVCKCVHQSLVYKFISIGKIGKLVVYLRPENFFVNKRKLVKHSGNNSEFGKTES